MVSDLTFEIIIRVLEHVTGPGEARECGQKEEPQHGGPLQIKASSASGSIKLKA